MSGLKPEEIEIRSMEIIDGLLPPGDWSPGELAVVKRLVHTCGDPSLADVVRFSAGAIEAGLDALRRGAHVYTDTRMALTGINTNRVQALGGDVHCAISDGVVVDTAKSTGHTRAATAMRLYGPSLDGAIIALGNAPTALREVLALAAEGIARPALVIGMPVGFVDAAESKDALMASDLTYISIQGCRGGSALAAAAVNALLRLI